MVAQLLQDPVHHVQVELVDELGLLEHGDEGARGQGPALGVHPASEPLFVAHASVRRAHDGLVKDLDPTLLERAVEVVDQVLAQLLLFFHGAVVVLIARVVVAARSVAGVVGAIAGGAHVHVAHALGVDADLDADVLGADQLLEIGEEPAQVRLDPRLGVGVAERREVVLADATAAVTAETLGEQL